MSFAFVFLTLITIAQAVRFRFWCCMSKFDLSVIERLPYLFPPIFTQFIKTFFSDDPLMVIANYYFGQWPVFNTWQVQPKYALVMTTKKRTPGPNFIELLSDEICSVWNVCLDENRITNQISTWFSGFISKQQLNTQQQAIQQMEILVGNPVFIREEISCKFCA